MPERTKLILSVLICALVAGGLGTGIYLGYDKMAELDDQTGKVQKKVEAEDDKLARVPVLKTAVLQLTDTVVRYERILPNNRELVNIVNFFNIAKEGAGISQLSSTPVKKRPRTARNAVKLPYEKHAFEISFTSSFEQLVTFINLLETQPRFMQVQKFSINGGDDPNLLDAKITISTYEFKPENATTSGSPRNRRSRSSRSRS